MTMRHTNKERNIYNHPATLALLKSAGPLLTNKGKTQGYRVHLGWLRFSKLLGFKPWPACCS